MRHRDDTHEETDDDVPLESDSSSGIEIFENPNRVVRDDVPRLAGSDCLGAPFEGW